MTADYPRTQWDRAVDAIRDADLLLANGGFDGAASRAYYAAFHAVTALFSLEGRIFTKHSAVEAAVHRDLVKAGSGPLTWAAISASVRNCGASGTMGPTYGSIRSRPRT